MALFASTYKIYVKVSPKGLLYLGYTKRDPLNYLGSGTYWKQHCKAHNFQIKDITTYVLHECSTKEEIQKYGVYYSELFNVVKSSKWANLTTEQGQGNAFWTGKKRKGIFKNWEGKEHWTKRPEVRAKIANTLTGRERSKEANLKNSITLTGRVKSKEHLKNLSSTKLGDQNPQSKQVLNLETGEIYATVREACKALNMCRNSVLRRTKKELNLKLI